MVVDFTGFLVAILVLVIAFLLLRQYIVYVVVAGLLISLGMYLTNWQPTEQSRIQAGIDQTAANAKALNAANADIRDYSENVVADILDSTCRYESNKHMVSCKDLAPRFREITENQCPNCKRPVIRTGLKFEERLDKYPKLTGCVKNLQLRDDVSVEGDFDHDGISEEENHGVLEALCPGDVLWINGK